MKARSFKAQQKELKMKISMTNPLMSNVQLVSIAEFRRTAICKILAVLLIFTFLFDNISWGAPGQNLATAPMSQPLRTEDLDTAMVKFFVESCIQGKSIPEITGEIPSYDGKATAYFNDKTEQRDGTYRLPVNFGGHAYSVEVARDGSNITASRVNGEFNVVDRAAFDMARSLGLKTLPVISDEDPIIKAYVNATEGTIIPNAIVSNSSGEVFGNNVVEYARNNMECDFVIMASSFFEDFPKVQKYLEDLSAKEKETAEASVANTAGLKAAKGGDCPNSGSENEERKQFYFECS